MTNTYEGLMVEIEGVGQDDNEELCRQELIREIARAGAPITQEMKGTWRHWQLDQWFERWLEQQDVP